jgi:16S rRNA (cytosine1402-N4)-methyltransferase
MSPSRVPMHESVLAEAVLRWLAPQPGEIWVDGTTGGGGHTRLIAQAVGLTGRVLALDQDATMLALANLTEPNVTTVHANFDQLAEVLRQQKIERVDGVLADLGFSSDQLGDVGRGLSFKHDGPLDMRLNRDGELTAADIVNTWDEKEIADTLYEYGEERKSRWVAKRIVERRKVKKFETTADLADVVRRCVPASGGIDPATRTFQALRIAVNDELGALERLLQQLPAVLAPGGRAGIISFHSLEDRKVKWAFREEQHWEVLTRKPVEADEAETARNPRARSAKFRVAKRRP